MTIDDARWRLESDGAADPRGVRSTISVVVIGLNEERRLRAALASLVGPAEAEPPLEIFYVDSGSTDGSLAIAESFASVQVVRLDDPAPSAAKARNAGLRKATGRYVQFLDGDCELDTRWLATALPLLESTPDIGSVFGRIEEIGNEASIFARLCGYDWYTPPGDYRMCGGNALWRREVFDRVGAFDAELLAGEEPDLCYRARQAGYRIVGLDSPMVYHDLEMATFREYWRRGVRSGRAYWAVAARYRNTEERLWSKECVRNLVEPLVWVVLASGIFVSPAVGWMPLGLWTLYRTATLARVSRHRTPSVLESVLYAVHLQFMRLPHAYGQLLEAARRPSRARG